MTKTLKVLFVVLTLLAVGGWFYPLSSIVHEQPVTYSSTTGTTFNTAKVAAIVFTPATAAATSTSIYNGDASDRKIQSFFADCSGMGTSFAAYSGAGLVSGGLIFSYATTSTANPNTPQTANAISISVATTTPDSYNITGAATTTPTGLQRVWAAGSYATFSSNATNTASCVVGVNYLAS